MKKENINEVLNTWFSNKTDKIHTVLPGQVICYEGHKERKAEIKPMVKIRNTHNQIIELSPIKDVPIVFPSTKNFNMIYPLKKGDGVLLLFSESAIGNFLSNTTNNPVEADDLNRFNMADCIAIPGLWGFKNLPTPPENDNDFVLQFQQAILKMTDNVNDIFLKNDTGNISIENSLIDLSNSISSVKQEIEKLWDSLISINTNLQSWTSTNCVIGSPVTPNPATLALFVADNVQANIDKTAVGSLFK